MEIIQGKQALFVSSPGQWTQLSTTRLSTWRDCLIDLGTGDGRFVIQAARQAPGLLAIGVDACRENLRRISRSAPENVMFAIANACALPPELTGLASRLTINFPWGSLLVGLLEGNPALMAGMSAVMRPGARLEVRLNASALAEAGWALDPGGAQVYRSLTEAGFMLKPPRYLTATDLRDCPTTWAKRLAYGRRPEAIYLQGRGM